MNKKATFFLVQLLVFNLAFSQIKITGTVSDKEGPLPGATIIQVEAKKNGTFRQLSNRTSTDFDGNYNLVVPDTTAILEFTYSGHKDAHFVVGNQKKIDITLEIDTKALEEVEVIGYKPVIYLYPEKKTDVNVHFHYSGEVLVTYPEYNDQWKVYADPSGKIINKADNKEYSYLFWEGKRTYKAVEKQYKSGFIVAQEDTVTFLQQTLTTLGLKPHEYNEFIVFWLPKLLENKWNFIYFRTGAEYNLISKNYVTPEPDTNIRIFMEFKGLEKQVDISPQQLETPNRKGFTLVEWGGSEMNEKILIKDKKGNYISK